MSKLVNGAQFEECNNDNVVVKVEHCFNLLFVKCANKIETKKTNSQSDEINTPYSHKSCHTSTNTIHDSLLLVMEEVEVSIPPSLTRSSMTNLDEYM